MDRRVRVTVDVGFDPDPEEKRTDRLDLRESLLARSGGGEQMEKGWYDLSYADDMNAVSIGWLIVKESGDEVWLLPDNFASSRGVRAQECGNRLPNVTAPLTGHHVGPASATQPTAPGGAVSGALSFLADGLYRLQQLGSNPQILGQIFVQSHTEHWATNSSARINGVLITPETNNPYHNPTEFFNAVSGTYSWYRRVWTFYQARIS